MHWNTRAPGYPTAWSVKIQNKINSTFQHAVGYQTHRYSAPVSISHWHQILIISGLLCRGQWNSSSVINLLLCLAPINRMAVQTHKSIHSARLSSSWLITCCLFNCPLNCLGAATAVLGDNTKSAYRWSILSHIEHTASFYQLDSVEGGYIGKTHYMNETWSWYVCCCLICDELVVPIV